MRHPLGIPDDRFEQRTIRRGLITKQEVRAVSLAKLALRPGDIVWDIGTATGSVAIEAANLVGPAGWVLAVEKNAEDAAIARRNVERFGATNVTVVHGRAPEVLTDWPDPDAVFIGGSSGSMADLVRLAAGRLRPRGRLVANVVTLENLQQCLVALREVGWPSQIVLLQVARSRPILDLTRLEALDPVYVVAAARDEAGGEAAPQPEGSSGSSGPSEDDARRSGGGLGRFYGLGVGPGDPELITIKAHRILAACPVVAVPKGRRKGDGFAWQVVRQYVDPARQEVLELDFPMTRDPARVETEVRRNALTVLRRLEAGLSVAAVTEGDPFFYSTFVHLYEQLRQVNPEVEVEVVPGVSSFLAAAARLGFPLGLRDDRLAVVAEVGDVEDARRVLEGFDTVVFLKVSAYFDTVWSALESLGRLADARLVTRVSVPGQERLVYDIRGLRGHDLDYFSLLLVRKIHDRHR